MWDSPPTPQSQTSFNLGFEWSVCSQAMLEVTDGWYSLPCKPDPALQDLIGRKRLAVGEKIITTGAELAGSQEACSPLEVGVVVLHICVHVLCGSKCWSGIICNV